MTTAAVTVSRHPLLLDKLTRLRDRHTPPPIFRSLVRELTQLLFFDAMADLKVKPRTVETPLAPCEGYEIAEGIELIPILRAGLGMADAILDMVPTARVWHLGLYRDHRTLQPVTYYNKLPAGVTAGMTLVVDPMLATGGSAVAAVSLLKQWGAQRLKFMGLIAAPEGVKALQQAHPDVPQHLAAIDSHLNEHCYIVPGLGDAGDRQFATS